MKKILSSLGAGFLILVLTFLPAQAEEISAVNSNTGADSSNETSAELENKVEIKNQNKTNISNNLLLDLSTGENTANSNTGNGSVSSGDIGADVTLKNEVSGIASSHISIDENGNITVSNSNTGANSENEAEAEIKNKIEITNKNHTDITNKTKLNLNTGGNEADSNTGNGSVESGDINVGVKLINKVLGIEETPDEVTPPEEETPDGVGGIGGFPQSAVLGAAVAVNPLVSAAVGGLGGAPGLGGVGELPEAGASMNLIAAITALLGALLIEVVKKKKAEYSV